MRELKPGNLVITADIPLAADVIAKGGPEALGNTDRKRFADQLDRFLAKQAKG